MRLTLTRTLDNDCARVWRAFTEPAELAAWFWPERFATVAEVDLRVGGRYRIAGPGAGLTVTGEYLEVEPPRRLVFTWRWGADEPPTVVTVELAEAGPRTRLTISHDRFADAGDRDNHAQGWADCLDRLPAHLAATPAHRPPR